MREILFRGQTRRFGEKVKNFAGDPMPSNWVYGGVCCGEGAFSIIYAYMDEEKEIPIEKHVVYTDTIGQYTGLTDKNGKRIFEGDIVKCSDETYGYGFIAIVMFGNPNGEYNWGFQLKRIRGASANTDILLWVDMEESGAYIEVIGNIHDNPELLKGGE